MNLERPLRANARLDGHFVLGHVDGTAELIALDALGEDNWWLRIRVPDDLQRYIVEKGSLAVDGISLTVAEIKGTEVAFTIIPHTYRHTTLHGYRAGARSECGSGYFGEASGEAPREELRKSHCVCCSARANPVLPSSLNKIGLPSS